MGAHVLPVHVIGHVAERGEQALGLGVCGRVPGFAVTQLAVQISDGIPGQPGGIDAVERRGRTPLLQVSNHRLPHGEPPLPLRLVEFS